MRPDELKEAVAAKMGKRGGNAFARLVGIDRATLYRWEAGICPIPVWVGVLLGLLPDKG